MLCELDIIFMDLLLYSSLSSYKQKNNNNIVFFRLFSPDPSTTRICAYILMLPRFCSCALAQLQKCSHDTYFPACTLVLNTKPFNCYSSSYFLHLYPQDVDRYFYTWPKKILSRFRVLGSNMLSF